MPPTTTTPEAPAAQNGAGAAAPRAAAPKIERTPEPAALPGDTRAFNLLHVGFVVLPLLMGIDKFAHVLTDDWTRYLAHWMNTIIPGTAGQAMHMVGIVEIIAAALVAVKPKYGAPVVAAWLAGIIVSLLSVGGYGDVALRDFGLLIAALALTSMAWARDRKSRNS